MCPWATKLTSLHLRFFIWQWGWYYPLHRLMRMIMKHSTKNGQMSDLWGRRPEISSYSCQPEYQNWRFWECLIWALQKDALGSVWGFLTGSVLPAEGLRWSIQWVEPEAAAKHPAMHKTAPHKRVIWPQVSAMPRRKTGLRLTQNYAVLQRLIYAVVLLYCWGGAGD